MIGGDLEATVPKVLASLAAFLSQPVKQEKVEGLSNNNFSQSPVTWRNQRSFTQDTQHFLPSSQSLGTKMGAPKLTGCSQR